MTYVAENKTGQRQTSVDLNLVPFIDLMSVCIIFLLITAVWTQVSMIQLGTSVHGKKVDVSDPVPSPKTNISFRVDVLSKGYKVLLGSRSVIIPISKAGVYNHRAFLSHLEKIKKRYPNKKDVVVTSEDSMLYKNVIMTMDLLLKAGFSGLSIATGEVI